jgi:hypothetical protein
MLKISRRRERRKEEKEVPRSECMTGDKENKKEQREVKGNVISYVRIKALSKVPP